MLAETRQLVRHAVGSQANVAVDVAPDLWPVAADKHRLEVALLNLAANARDAMPDGGTLTIAARNLPAGAPRAEACPAGDCVVISVADTGTGMPPDVLARALEPFFTTKGIGRGTGLGLAMVHGFATESNGGLAIRTAPGKGTAVDIFVPRNDTAGAEAAHDGSPHPSVDNHAQILVVDDDDLVRAVTTGLLEDMGYQVLAASNAEAGYALVHATPHIDLVLSDVVMPRVSGPAMAARLRADFPALRIVFMTGYRDRHDLDGESVLQKPFTPASLARFVAGSLTPTAGQ
jgi:CheY-like chemotaxis protein